MSTHDSFFALRPEPTFPFTFRMQLLGRHYATIEAKKIGSMLTVRKRLLLARW